MSNIKDIALFSLVLVGAAAGGLYYLSAQNGQNEGVSGVTQEAASDPARMRLEQQDQERQNRIREEFEAALNGFLTTVDQRMAQYQGKRKAVRDMVKPENMRQFDYVGENYDMAKTIIADMERDMGDIIALFEKTDLTIQSFLQREDPGDKDKFLAQWENVKNEQLALYVGFFAFEKRLLVEHERIFDVYLRSEGQYVVDVIAGEVTFNDAALTREYIAAKREIERILFEQKRLLGQDVEQTAGADDSAGEGAAAAENEFSDDADTSENGDGVFDGADDVPQDPQ